VSSFFAQPSSFFDPLSEPESEADFARRRLPTRTYLSRSFPIKSPSRDAGHPGRFVRKVFDHEPAEDHGPTVEWSEETLVDGARRQIMLLVAREAGRVKEIKIQRVPNNGDVEDLLVLNREGASRLVSLVRLLEHLPVEGGNTVRLDDDIVQQLLNDPEGMRSAYSRAPDRFANLITEDVSASDVIALARRRQQVEEFRRLLADEGYFQDRQAELGKGPEGIWQHFLEENPWVLGVGLGGQLLTSWDEARLEQPVVGHSVTGAGKRVDALMRTVGSINSMVFAEIKHHRTPLLEEVKTPYRPECWAPSRELAGGVTQIQQTVHRATTDITERLADIDEDGFETGGFTYLIRPRCYLIAGNLSQMTSDTGGVHVPKFRSFELYRRNLYEPLVLTFDELLSRAEWHLAEAERQTSTE
jgi:hypothetical protein